MYDVEAASPVHVVVVPELLRQSIDIVLPVRDEARVLAVHVRQLHDYMCALSPLAFRITIVENGSRDATWEIAAALASTLSHVQALRLDGHGKGRAVRYGWERSDADVLVYMDIDLSTGLDALLPLVAPVLTGHSDLAIGTRLDTAARVKRGLKREFLSRSYNFLLRRTLGVGFSDAQCGFKAGRGSVVQALLPHVVDDTWFFDTELLVLAERCGSRIHQVPVDWVDDPDSRVCIWDAVREDLKGIWRLWRTHRHPVVVIPRPAERAEPLTSGVGQRESASP